MAGVTDRDSKQDETDLEAAQAEWKLSEDAYTDQRKREVEDQKFESGEHFTAEELSYLKNSGKPDVIMDQTSGQVAKVTNQPVHRMVISPNGGGADPTTAEYWQGICRRVENLSNAEDVYKWGRRHAIVMGRGFWRVRAGYFSRLEYRPDGQYPLNVFQQDLRIEPFLYQHAVHEDPRTGQLDFSDQRFTHITSDVDWSEFQRLYPKTKESELPHSFGDFKSTLGDAQPGWANEKTIRIRERYWIEDQVIHLCVVDVDGMGTLVALEKNKDFRYAPEQIKAENVFRIPKVKWWKDVGGKRILDRKDVPGQYIPVVKIVGERRVIDNKEDCRGMVRMAKHPQRMVDFYEMRLARAVDLGAEGVWLAPYRAVGSNEDMQKYANANKDRPAVLFYNDEENGQPIAPPQFVHATPQIQHLVIAAQRASMSLRSALGVPDVTPDESRPEQSGRAIRARQAEQAQATSHYGDATKSGVRLTGLIIMSQAREIYDAARILRINGKDEKEINLLVAKGEPDPAAYQRLGLRPDQIEHMLDVSAGEFDVTVTGGKLKDTQRQESVEVIQSILPVLPPPVAVKAAGAMVRQIDGLGELAEQLSPADDSGMVPTEELDRVKQQAEGMLKEASQKIDELQQHIDSKRDELTAKVQIETYKVDKQAETDRYKTDAEVTKAHIAARAQVMTPHPAMPEFG